MTSESPKADLAGRNILLTGAAGMLAGHLIPQLAAAEAGLVLTDVVTSTRNGRTILPLNLTNPAAVKDAVSEIRPHWIINCAAYTKVDEAETAQEAAFAVNGNGPANLASAAKKAGARLLHISTDYVFGGTGADPNRTEPYREDDTPSPCGVYGQSKRFGDELVQSTLPDQSLIVRTSWLHGIHGPNFIDTILRLGKEREELSVVNDQIGSPTWADWLSSVIVELVARDARGLYHAASRGNISWFEFAKEICSQAGLPVVIKPQSTQELGRPAPRPAFSTLDVSKLEAFLGRECISWKDCVRAHLAARAAAR